jgi:hypothetical protein
MPYCRHDTHKRQLTDLEMVVIHVAVEKLRKVPPAAAGRWCSGLPDSA